MVKSKILIAFLLVGIPAQQAFAECEFSWGGFGDPVCSRNGKKYSNVDECKNACVGSVSSKFTSIGGNSYMIQKGDYCYKAVMTGKTPSGSPLFTYSEEGDKIPCDSYSTTPPSQEKAHTVDQTADYMGNNWYKVTRNGKCYKEQGTSGVNDDGPMSLAYKSRTQIDCDTNKEIATSAKNKSGASKDGAATASTGNSVNACLKDGDVCNFDNGTSGMKSSCKNGQCLDPTATAATADKAAANPGTQNDNTTQYSDNGAIPANCPPGTTYQKISASHKNNKGEVLNDYLPEPCPGSKSNTKDIVPHVYSMDYALKKCNEAEYKSGDNCQQLLAQQGQIPKKEIPDPTCDENQVDGAGNPKIDSDCLNQKALVKKQNEKIRADNANITTKPTSNDNIAVVDEDGKIHVKDIDQNGFKADNTSGSDLAKSEANKRLNGAGDPTGANPYQRGGLDADAKKDGTTIGGSQNQYLADKDSIENIKTARSRLGSIENGKEVTEVTAQTVDENGKVQTKTYTDGNRSDFKDDIRSAKDAKKDDRKDAKQARKDAKASDGVTDANVLKMQNKDDAKNKACGNYGGADCETTSTINAAAMAGEQLGSVAGALAVNTTGNKAADAVAKKGLTATQDDINKSQIDTAKAAQKSETTMIVVDSLGALMQTDRLLKHQKSESKIGATATGAQEAMAAAQNGAITVTDVTNQTAVAKDKNQYGVAIGLTGKGGADVNGNAESGGKVSEEFKQRYRKYYDDNIAVEKSKCKSSDKPDKTQAAQQAKQKEDCEKYAESITDQAARNSAVSDTTKNIAENRDTEVAKQAVMAKEQVGNVLNTMKSLAGHVQGLLAAKAAAKLVAAQATGPHFTFTPGAGGPNGPTDPSVMPTPDTGAIVADTNTTPDAPLDKGLDQFNPNPGDGVAGSPKGDFVSAPPQPPAGGAPGGLAGNGTTSAPPKPDDAGKPQDAPGKNQGGGTYGNDGGGSGYARNGGGGSPGVGIDTNFADLLKKFLPGGEEDKAKTDGAIAFEQDRSLASDKAAVLGRNQNIFEEVHKRYIQKSSEGAVIYSI